MVFSISMTGENSVNKNLTFQRFLGWMLIIPFAYAIKTTFLFICRYKVENLKEARAQYEAIVNAAEKEGAPILFCANHLTFIDSVILLWVFNPAWKYIVNYRRQYWNVPAGDFFARMKRFRYFMSAAKCIFVFRDASAEHKAEVLSRLKAVLSSGDSLLIFPEGKRSRTGRFTPATLASGAARLVLHEPKAKLVCVYVRGHFQKTFSNYPENKSSFHVQISELKVDAYRNLDPSEAKNKITAQIGETLFTMEDTYFSTHPNCAKPELAKESVPPVTQIEIPAPVEATYVS